MTMRSDFHDVGHQFNNISDNAGQKAIRTTEIIRNTKNGKVER